MYHIVDIPDECNKGDHSYIKQIVFGNIPEFEQCIRCGHMRTPGDTMIKTDKGIVFL